MATTPNLILPYPIPDDDVDVPADIQALADRLESIVSYAKMGPIANRPPAGQVPDGGRWFATDTRIESAKVGGSWVNIATEPPLGSEMPYAGTVDPPGGAWLLADGRLLDQSAFTAFFALVGHAYNGGVDPGNGKFKLPDKRGRGSQGADSMATAMGSASRLLVANGHNNTRGMNGGSERHQLLTTEMPRHQHTGDGAASTYATINAGTFTNVVASMTIANTGFAGNDGFHNNMHPYEVDYWIVRVL